MALSARPSPERNVRDWLERHRLSIVSGDTLYHHALVGIDTSVGRLTPWDPTAANIKFAGLVTGLDDGTSGGSGQAVDSVAGNAAGTTFAFLNTSPVVLAGVPVTGASATNKGDLGKSVYAAGDDYNSQLTLTPTGESVGIVVAQINSTTCDVLLKSVDANALNASPELVSLGHADLSLFDADQFLNSVFLGRRYRVTLFGVYTQYNAGASGDSCDLRLVDGDGDVMASSAITVDDTTAVGLQQSVPTTNQVIAGDEYLRPEVVVTQQFQDTCEVEMWALVIPIAGAT